jgi:hypothetical protein
VTLTELPDLIQGTDEWLDQRRGMVTASVVGQLVTASTLKVAKNDYSRALTAQLVAERITGWTDPQFVSDDMLRGHEDEPRAATSTPSTSPPSSRAASWCGPRTTGSSATPPTAGG